MQKIVKTKKTELLFLALFLRRLKTGGRASVIVPDGVLFGSSKAHKELRRLLVEEHKLDAVVKLPSGVFRPYAGVCPPPSCASPRPVSAAPTRVWFYDVQADGYSSRSPRSHAPAWELETNPQLLLVPLQQREALLLYQMDPRDPTSRDDEVNAWREVFNYGKAL